MDHIPGVTHPAVSDPTPAPSPPAALPPLPGGFAPVAQEPAPPGFGQPPTPPVPAADPQPAAPPTTDELTNVRRQLQAEQDARYQLEQRQQQMFSQAAQAAALQQRQQRVQQAVANAKRLAESDPEQGVMTLAQALDQEYTAIHQQNQQEREAERTQMHSQMRQMLSPFYARSVATEHNLPAEWGEALAALDPNAVPGVAQLMAKINGDMSALRQQIDQNQRGTQAATLAASGAHAPSYGGAAATGGGGVDPNQPNYDPNAHLLALVGDLF